MNGYVAQRRGRFYAVIYEGRDPVTGKERRRWHPAGTDRADAERLATKLATQETKRTDAVPSLTFGAYLTSQWLPAKKLHLATSTYRGYERNVALHILPVLGRISIRRLRFQQIEDRLLRAWVQRGGLGQGQAAQQIGHMLLLLAQISQQGFGNRKIHVCSAGPGTRRGRGRGAFRGLS